jgi:hypothetical protein
MRPNTFRALLMFWLLCHGAVILSPILFGGWADWPIEAQRYAHWALYQTEIRPLPWLWQACVLGEASLFFGWVALWWSISSGRFIFLAGVLLHLYSHYSTVPGISSGTVATFGAGYHLLSGFVLGASFTGSDVIFEKKAPYDAVSAQ